MGMVLEVGREKHIKMQDDKRVQQNRERLNQRLKTAGLKEKRPIAGQPCSFFVLTFILYLTLTF